MLIDIPDRVPEIELPLAYRITTHTVRLKVEFKTKICLMCGKNFDVSLKSHTRKNCIECLNIKNRKYKSSYYKQATDTPEKLTAHCTRIRVARQKKAAERQGTKVYRGI